MIIITIITKKKSLWRKAFVNDHIFVLIKMNLANHSNKDGNTEQRTDLLSISLVASEAMNYVLGVS